MPSPPAEMSLLVRRLRRLAAGLGMAGLLAQGVAAQVLVNRTVVTTEQVRAELAVHAPQGIAAGREVWLGLSIRHAPEWHTYWKNPGDSGLPTALQWTLSGGVTAGEIDWPRPKRLPVGPLVNYGYEGDLLLPVRLAIPAGFAADRLDVKLRADWLVCKDVCIPETGEFALSVPAGASTATHSGAFEAAWAARPVAAAGAQARAEVLAEGDGVLRVRVAGLDAGWHGAKLDFYPEQAGVIDNAAPPQTRWDGTDWTTSVALSSQRTASPTEMDAVLAPPDGRPGVRVHFAVAGTWPALAPVPAPKAALAEAPTTPPALAARPASGGDVVGFGLALLLAIVGGALLNLMPCVFPVLSLKVLGFARHADDRRALLAGGLAYTAGVVASFVALAALMLALRAGGEQLGWGFQLQSPAFVAVLAALFTLIGLNLAGVFEFGSVMPGNLAALRLSHPLADHALTGVLAVAVASPCTAPFMGASLGVALTLPTAQALAVFGMLGLGMALPYLAASAWPALARRLPRPGAWMSGFRALMAFPMFATVVWLVWVVGQQAGIDAVAALLGTLVALAFVVWAFGARELGARARLALGTLALAALAAALVWTLPALRTAPAAAVASETGDGWEAWSPARVAALRAEGRPVFVDFTAAWCVTCQVNKRLVLTSPEVVAAFEQRRVALLRADWTRRDEAISAELARLGRSGVPVYALYAPQGGAPELLPELLSTGLVREALARL